MARALHVVFAIVLGLLGVVEVAVRLLISLLLAFPFVVLAVLQGRVLTMKSSKPKLWAMAAREFNK